MHDTRMATLLLPSGLLVTTSLAAPEEGHATEGHAADGHGGHGPEPSVIPSGAEIAPLIVSVVVFGIVFFILQAMVWPKISKGLDDRANKIREEIEAAEAARRQSKEALDEYEANLAEARAEAQSLLEKTRAEQQQLAAELRAKADAELTTMRERAMRDIEVAKRAAVNEIYQEATSLATIMAGKILGREVQLQDQERLIEESLNELHRN